MAVIFLQTSVLETNPGIDQPLANGCIIFNSETNVACILLAMKPNIDLFYHGDYRNEMLKPLTTRVLTGI